MKIYTDLSNLMKVNFITGIQRVAREIIIRMLKSGKYDIVLMLYEPRKRAFVKINNEKFCDFFESGKGERNNLITDKLIYPEEMDSGAVFFDIDSVWNTRMRRSFLFPILKRKGLKIATQLYDLIPIQNPQYCHENTVLNFMIYAGANIKYADLIITSANATVKQLDILTQRLGKERKKSVVVPLGCDFIQKNQQNKKLSEDVRKAVDNGRYILMVGTIEPRKNHKIVLDALDRGFDGTDMNVIFAGRIGWNVSELENRIKNHKLIGIRLFYFDNAKDSDIDYLYENAFAVAFPTYNEGFGLPVTEALSKNTPVLASDTEVLHEVGGDFADYFDNTDVNSFINTVKKYAQDEKKYNALKAHTADFIPYTWDKSAEEMMKQLDSLFIKSNITPPEKIKQMAVLTARNNDILSTLPYIDKFMKFITEIVICCPAENINELKSSYNGRITLKFLSDDELLNGNPLPDDHTTRNFFLRCLMMQNEIFDDVFIMTDDDYRPLCEIDIKTFVKDGRYQSYYCYELSEWKGNYENYTSFDTSMFRTLDFLQKNNLPVFQYSSHQPQIIDRRIYREMLKKYDGIQLQGLDEWSTYFNYGVYYHPDIFQPCKYVSMCWPGARSDWDLFVQPEKFLFENHYSVLYEENGIFQGLSETLNENTIAENMQKIMIYSKELQKQYEGRQAYDSYCRMYESIYNEKPSFTVYISESKLFLHTPVKILFKNDTWNRIPLYITNDVYNTYGAEKSVFSYYFSDSESRPLSDMVDIRIKKGDNKVYIPLRVKLTDRKCVLNLKFTAENKNEQASSAINTLII